jgi:hypothetical protein
MRQIPVNSLILISKSGGSHVHIEWWSSPTCTTSTSIQFYSLQPQHEGWSAAASIVVEGRAIQAEIAREIAFLRLGFFSPFLTERIVEILWMAFVFMIGAQ